MHIQVISTPINADTHRDFSARRMTLALGALLALILVRQASAVCQTGCNSGKLDTYLGENALINESTGSENTAVGFSALYSNSTGSLNVAVGVDALVANTSGGDNTAIGRQAMDSNTTGSTNTAIGSLALQSNLSGYNNVAIGWEALYSSGAYNNTSVGTGSMFYNTAGINNTAVGQGALTFNFVGNGNTAIGALALQDNKASNITGVGFQALNSNTTGASNTATGYNALFANTTGSRNTANGLSALANNSTGAQGTATGNNALFRNTTGDNNVAVGNNALFNSTTGSNNTALGTAAGLALTTGSNNVEIANKGVAGEANTIRVGTVGTQTATYVAGVSGATVAGGIGVIVDGNGHLGTTTSSARFKENILPMANASETILSLQPVTFRYKKELDSLGIPQFGLIAEDVARIDPNLVAKDGDGKPYSVRYEAINAMLLNEFLKEHRKVEEQTSVNREQQNTIDELKRAMAAQVEQIKALTTGLQKVTARLSAEKPVSRITSNN